MPAVTSSNNRADTHVTQPLTQLCPQPLPRGQGPPAAVFPAPSAQTLGSSQTRLPAVWEQVLRPPEVTTPTPTCRDPSPSTKRQGTAGRLTDTAQNLCSTGCTQMSPTRKPVRHDVITSLNTKCKGSEKHVITNTPKRRDPAPNPSPRCDPPGRAGLPRESRGAAGGSGLRRAAATPFAEAERAGAPGGAHVLPGPDAFPPDQPAPTQRRAEAAPPPLLPSRPQR